MIAAKERNAMSAILIKDATVLTMRGGAEDVLRGDVLVQDGIIKAVGPHLSPDGVTEMVDARQMIVMPGLVNAHMHTWQTARGFYLRESIAGIQAAQGAFNAFNNKRHAPFGRGTPARSCLG
jgi:imidazolonepropionase-like amidohydrolase